MGMNGDKQTDIEWKLTYVEGICNIRWTNLLRTSNGTVMDVTQDRNEHPTKPRWTLDETE
jgi:hypothetical protein